MFLKYLITYYLVSTGIMMWYITTHYEGMVKSFPIFGIMSKNMWGYIQLIIGCLIFPICFPMILYGYYLGYKIKQLKKINHKLKSNNDLIKFISEIYNEKVDEAIKNFELDGEVFLMTFILTRNKEVIGFIMNAETKEQLAQGIVIVQDHCKQHNTICVITVGEAVEKLLDKDEKVIEEKEFALIQYETKNYTEEIRFDLDHENKKLINPTRIKDGNKLYGDYLEEI